MSKTTLVFGFLAGCLFLTACEFHPYPYHPHSYDHVTVDSDPIVIVESPPVVVHGVYSCYGNYEDPFYYSPDWCDSWNGGTCCTWDLYDASYCGEEWCWWDDYCGWEYSVTICNEVEIYYYD